MKDLLNQEQDPQAQKPAAQQVTDTIAQQIEALTKIEGHLKSIRSMMSFFVVMFILAVILQACSALGAL